MSGTLRVTAHGPSSSFWPIEVRNADLSLVTSVIGSTTLDLPAGLYLVSSSSPEMGEVQQVHEVAEDEVAIANVGTRVIADEVPNVGTNPSLEDTSRWTLAYDAVRTVQAFEPGVFAKTPVAVPTSADDVLGTSAGDSPRDAVRLRSADGATAVEADGSWLVLNDSSTRIPAAELTLGNRSVTLSLPVGGESPDRVACVIVGTQVDGIDRIQVRFPANRGGAASLDALVRAGDLRSAQEVAQLVSDQALQEEQRDPMAATLAALVIHRFGRLQERAAWVDDLSNGFGWIPDTAVIRAAVLSEGGKHKRQEALELLASIRDERLVFTEALSLLLQLLRRWPDEGQETDLRAALLDVQAPIAATVDWGAMCLTNYRPLAEAARDLDAESPTTSAPAEEMEVH